MVKKYKNYTISKIMFLFKKQCRNFQNISDNKQNYYSKANHFMQKLYY